MQKSQGEEQVYLDHAATSPLRAEVWSAMEEAVGTADYNPSSPHSPGQSARERLEDARLTLARCLGVEKRRIVFTGGGTVSDNLAVLGFARTRPDPHIFVSAVEHKAVLYAAEEAARGGATVERIPVDGEGVIRLGALRQLLEEKGDAPCLVSVMWANNEVGTVQPVKDVARLAREQGALFHTDAVQALGKVPLSLEELSVDLLSATAHKLGGPVGIGLLYVRDGLELEPITRGGSQERSLWPGTQNPVAATGFAEAARLAVEERPESAGRWRRLRDGLVDRLREGLDDVRVHGGDADERLPQLLSVGLPGLDESALLVSLDMEGIALSSGSACSSGSAAASHVLEAMGIDHEPDGYAVLRFSFGPETTREQVERAGDAVVRVAERLRAGRPA